MIHDVYFEYLEFALERNFLNFGFLQLFAFVLLCVDHVLRDRVAFEYVMVDEFQDTNEIRFELALLLAGTDNLCVVSDWKQTRILFLDVILWRTACRQFEKRTAVGRRT